MNSILDRRLGSSYPISIGTSLALETIGRPRNGEENHVIPDLPQPFNTYGVFGVSVNTLIKNLIDSINPGDLPKDYVRTHKFIMDQVDQELGVIKEVSEGKAPNIVFHPYVNTFATLNILLERLGKKRTFSGNVGKKHQLYINVLKEAVTRGYTVYNSYTKVSLMSPGSKVISLTSFPVDIISNERALTLLEPHTGRGYMYNEFFRKLYPVPKADMSVIPFNIVTYLLFGDKYVVKPTDIKIRRMFIRVAEENSFIYNTPKSKVIDDISASIYTELKQAINKFKNL